MSRPVVSVGRVRRAIRRALKIRPGTGKSEGILLEMVNELVGGGVSLQELRDGLEFCQGEHQVRSVFNKEVEQDEWFITDHGASVDIG
jgi:hypothetical protein